MNFERLASRHKDAVYRQLYRMCGNHDDAEDILVEALLKAHRAMDSLQEETNFRAWLAQIGRRACGRLKHKERLRPVINLADVSEYERADSSPESDAIQAETKECLLNTYNGLPETYREVYRLRDIEGLSGDETAAKLGINLRTMKTRLHRARKLVREKVDAAFDPSARI